MARRCWRAAAPRVASGSRRSRFRLSPAERPGGLLRKRCVISGRARGLPFSTLKRRAEFLRVRGGARYSARGFLLEGRRREAVAQPAEDRLRIGFTVTKKLGGAVVRNRIRRRLRAAIAACGAPYASEPLDCVVVARAAAADQIFEELASDMAKALETVSRTATSQRSGAGARRP